MKKIMTVSFVAAFAFSMLHSPLHGSQRRIGKSFRLAPGLASDRRGHGRGPFPRRESDPGGHGWRPFPRRESDPRGHGRRPFPRRESDPGGMGGRP